MAAPTYTDPSGRTVELAGLEYAFQKEQEFLFGKDVRGKSILQTWQDDMLSGLQKQWNQPSPMLDRLAKQEYPKEFNMPAQEVTYGRLVRIPTVNEYEGGPRFVDVTEKDAKRSAKRLKKLARQIEKACR